MTKKNKKPNKAISTAIISALAYIVLGFVMIFYPDKVSIALCYTLGGALTVYGLFNLITYFATRQASFGFEMIVGIAATAFGVFFLISPQSILGMIAAIIGILIIVDSAIDIKRAFQLKALNVKYWWISFIVSALIIVFAIVTIIFPTFFADIIMIVLGIALVYEGVSGLALLASIGYFAKKVKSDAKMIDIVPDNEYEED
ncbi:HdeD family acid-resistance protein [Ruminococcus sp.]|uniref:HdeD family acid-resistance protein n=1 Tax=Ruminococcus sp. TaxID=41978 RepID=UPI00386C66CE